MLNALKASHSQSQCLNFGRLFTGLQSFGAGSCFLATHGCIPIAVIPDGEMRIGQAAQVISVSRTFFRIGGQPT
jgi:hypothetical protein